MLGASRHVPSPAWGPTAGRTEPGAYGAQPADKATKSPVIHLSINGSSTFTSELHQIIVYLTKVASECQSLPWQQARGISLS